MLLTKILPKRLIGVLTLGLLVAIAPVAIATAACTANAQSCGTDYQVTEAFFGAGGQLGVPGDGCSDHYCAKSSVGELGAGKSCSPGDQKCIQAGFNTNREAYIEFIINPPSDVDVGVLESDETHVGTASFSIKTYLAQGYQITTNSLPPKITNHTFDTPTPGAAASTVGTEQFGMNLVENSCPGTAPTVGSGSCTGTLGADPVCDPVDFCNYPANVSIPANYGTADNYYYPSGGAPDTLVTSTSSTGFAKFTLSYIFNISNVTPAGKYTMAHDLVATSTF